MILSFEFQYNSQNGVLENLLKSICEEFDIDYKINKQNTIVTLYVDAEEERLGAFADFMSSRLPLSIFFKSSSVTVVEEIQDSIHVDECTLTLPYTLKALQSAKDESSEFFMSPFVTNEIGNSPFSNVKNISLKDKSGQIIAQGSDKESYISLYETISNLIIENKKVRINSSCGDFVYTQVSSEAKDKVEDTFKIIATDLSVVEKMVVIKENEIKALASLEKPAIKLRVNTLFEAKKLLDTTRVKIQLADDMLIQLISEQLIKDSVEFLYKENTEDTTYDYEVSIDGSISNIPQLEVCVLENGEILIVEGDGYCASSVKENLKKFENVAHGQFTSIIQEHNLFKDQVSCFYISKENDNRLMHVSEQTGLIDLVVFPIEKSFSKIFDKIQESSTGAKLLENYTKEFPELVENAKSVIIPKDASDSIYSMWAICAVLLGISKTYEGAAEKMIELAEDYGGQKGPRIDYSLFDNTALFSNFNFIKMVRSCMSFKLAGTDNPTLSFGFLESLAYFLSDSADNYRENMTSSRMLLGGSMFGIKRLSELACRNIQANSFVAFNRELPIDN